MSKGGHDFAVSLLPPFNYTQPLDVSVLYMCWVVEWKSREFGFVSCKRGFVDRCKTRSSDAVEVYLFKCNSFHIQGFIKIIKDQIKTDRTNERKHWFNLENIKKSALDSKQPTLSTSHYLRGTKWSLQYNPKVTKFYWASPKNRRGPR